MTTDESLVPQGPPTTLTPETISPTPPRPWLPPRATGDTVDRVSQRPGWQVAAIVVLVILAQALSMVIMGLAPALLPNSELAQGLLVLGGFSLSAALAYVGFTLIVARIGRRPGLATAGRGRIEELVWGLLVGAALISVTFGVLAALGVYRVTDIGWTPQILWGIGVGVGPGFVEEIFFRGAFLRLLDARFGSWVGLALTSLVFGAMHLMNPGATFWGAFAIALEAGILLGAAYLLTRRLWLAIGIHIGWNATLGALFGGDVSGSGSGRGFFESTLTGKTWLTGGTMGVEGSVVTVVVCTLAGVVMLGAAHRAGRILPSLKAERHQ